MNTPLSDNQVDMVAEAIGHVKGIVSCFVAPTEAAMEEVLMDMPRVDRHVADAEVYDADKWCEYLVVLFEDSIKRLKARGPG